MNYTPDEIAELLKERPNQAHYIAWLVQKAVTEAVLAERERARDYFYEQALAMVEAEREACAKLVADTPEWRGNNWFSTLCPQTKGAICDAIRGRGQQ